MPSEEETYRSQAEALLRLAAATDNMRDRSRLIDEAMHWHNRAAALQEDTLPDLDAPEGDARSA